MFTTTGRHLSWSALVIACALGVNGCAHDPATVAKQEAAAVSSQAAATASTKAETVLAGKSAKPAQDQAIQNPVSIAFDRSSVKLSDSAKVTLEQLASRAKNEKGLTITGYCDRKQIGNAKAAALARAAAVKKELVRLGVSSKTIRVRFNTEVADKHAADIKF